MDRAQSVGCFLHRLMIIYYLHAFRTAIIPNKTNTPLIIDPDTILALSVGFERFKPIPRRRLQVQQPVSAMQILQLAASGILNIRRQLSRTFAMKDPLGFGATKADDHCATISHRDNMSSNTRLLRETK